MYLTQLEQEIDINFLIEKHSKEQVTSLFPFINLSQRQLFYDDLKGKRTGMNSSEKKFANCLMDNGYILYHEPKISECVRVPDFLVCKKGFLDNSLQVSVVEITTMSLFQKGADKRKFEQIRDLEEVCEIHDLRFKALFKEDLNVLYDIGPDNFF